MNQGDKRKGIMEDENRKKRVKKECDYGDRCYRKNPAHFREFSHAHLEAILDLPKLNDQYQIPEKYSLQKHMITEQLDIIVEKNLYEPPTKDNGQSSSSSNTPLVNATNDSINKKDKIETTQITSKSREDDRTEETKPTSSRSTNNEGKDCKLQTPSVSQNSTETGSKDSDYRPIIPPTRRAEEYLKVVVPKGKMAAKLAASAPYNVFYTTITDAKETHRQKYSITFLEILDHSLGELKCSLQINFMVEPAWLLAQYYFAGYSAKKLTILYGEECDDMKSINKKKPNVDAHCVAMATPFGKHHTKMMILCYEDGSLRVVVSTANLYYDDWENRTQGLWISPACPELPPEAMPHEGDSPTGFKRCLLRYLNHYHLPALCGYTERVKRCDFSHINVFLVATVPGSHGDAAWAMNKVGALLRQHCAIPGGERWPLLAQSSSIGSFGKEPRLWLTGDFLHNFTKIKDQPQMLMKPQELKFIYPSLENVRQSHDDLLGGGCLPYGADVHARQPWLLDFLYQWKATKTHRSRAMPHIKSYCRVDPELTRCAYLLLTSANVSKAAWGVVNKKDGALRTMSYEAGVLLLPRFVLKEDFFPLEEGATNQLILPYDLPPVKYESGMSPWVSDYLR